MACRLRIRRRESFTHPEERNIKSKQPSIATLIASACTAGLFSFAGHAVAGTATSNLAVSATVSPNCTISTSALAFGTYDPLSASALNGTGSVTITCVRNTAATIGLGNGANFAAATRNMNAAGTLLAYSLYQPPSTVPGAACSYASPTAWGNSGAGLFTPTAAPDKTARAYNVCGQIAAGQDVGAGAYTDTVVATVNF